MNANDVKFGVSRLALKISKISPEILLGVGIVGVVGGTVLACKATLKVESVIAESKEMVETIHGVYDSEKDKPVAEQKYSEQDMNKDLAIVYARRGVDLLKLYAPAITVTGLGILAILGSHSILNRRYLAAGAAYTLVDEGFKKYRAKVVSEYGSEKDRELRGNGVKYETVATTLTNEEGKKIKVKKIISKSDIESVELNDYARVYGPDCPQWRHSPIANAVFLKSQQNYANDMLRVRGHVFLNDVYDMLSMPRTSAGAIVGWLYDENVFIDFGISDVLEGYREGDPSDPEYYYLDFNVQGLIYDRI